MSVREREIKTAVVTTTTTMTATDDEQDDFMFANARNSLDELRRQQQEQQQQLQQQSGSGCCEAPGSTDDSLSDETTLDLSQNSSESAKCQSSSDLESCSVSSIRKINEFTACDNLMSAEMAARRVSFPKKDSDLVTGYLEPANPWESATGIKTSTELTDLYRRSCLKHKTIPLSSVLVHLQSLELDKAVRNSCLNLKECYLTPEACEALEVILKRVQYQLIDLTACKLNDMAASAMFDMIEYYEATKELNISENPSIATSGWQSCVSMIRRSGALQSITIRGNALSELYAANLGKALNNSNLHTIKLEHCGLTGRPLASLCNALRKNTTLRELWLAYNDLYYPDADKLAELLKSNAHLQFLDVSNNNLKDGGIKTIAIALIEQAESLTFALKLLESQEKRKLCSVINACANITNNTKAIDIPLDKDETTSQQSDDSTAMKSSTNGSRSMLDKLLLMKPGECLEPVQSTANNNDYEKTITETITNNEKCDDYCSNDENVSTVTDLIDLADDDATPNELELIETNNENATTITTDTNLVLDLEQHDEKILLTNNNTLENRKTELLPDSPEIEHLKSYDMNENKEDNGCETPPLQFESIDDEGTNKESLEQTPNSSPIQLDKTKIDEDNQHQHQQQVAYTTRSHSSDSLSSENSLDTVESNLSAEIKEKIQKNDTLGRQKSNQIEQVVDAFKKPRGLQALVLWNNSLTRLSAEYIGDMLASTNSLELLNIGKNTLSNDFIDRIGNSLKHNRSLTNLGLQSSHLTTVGITKLADILQFGGNSTLQRIDIRDNYVQVDGLVALCDVLKSNKVLTRIDIDDEPKRLQVSSDVVDLNNYSLSKNFQDDGDSKFYYSKYLHTIRTLCLKNQTPLEIPAVRSSRKISLTCQSIHTPIMNVTLRNDNLDVKKKSGARLRSPLPSPPTVSPSSSPVPSPSRGSRFQVSRVLENGKGISARLESTPSPDSTRSSNCPSPTSRFHVTIVNTELDENKGFLPKGSAIDTKSSTKPTTIPNVVKDILGPTKNSTSETQFVFPDVEKPKAAITTTTTSDTPSLPSTLAPSAPNNPLEIVPIVENDAEAKAKLQTETRVRKSSWNTNLPTVDKLFSLFQNPFGRSNSNENDKKATDSDETKHQLTDALIRHITNTDEHRITKTTSIEPIRDNHPSKSQLFLDAATKQFKEFKDFSKQVLKQNTPAQQQQQYQQTQLPPQPAPPPPPSSIAIIPGDMTVTQTTTVTMTTTDIFDTHPKECELIPTNIKLEIKENISPKHSFSSNHSIPVYNELVNPDKILKIENQVVVIGEKVTNSETPLAKQDDDIHEI